MAVSRITTPAIANLAITQAKLASSVDLGGAVKIANVQVANSSWSSLDDTAVDTDGGYVLVNGTNFVTGCNVLIGNTSATSVSFVNSTQLRVQVPATAAGSYVMYVSNPDGSTAIRINAITFSAEPTWVTGSTLPNQVVDVAISLQLEATGATSYALQAGSSLPANTTLSSGGLFSGTITGIEEETLYNFTVEAIDDENQESPRSFALTVVITTGDINFKATTLLINGDETAFNKDESTNNFDIAVFGNTVSLAFSPYNTNWSTFFDGTGDFLKISGTGASVNFGTNDFTIEFWGYLNSWASIPCFFDTSPLNNANPTSRIHIRVGTTGILSYRTGAAASDVIASAAGAFSLYKWHHVAFTKTGGFLRLFLNGVQVGSSVADSRDYPLQTDRPSFGCNGYDETTQLVTGYISNMRVLKGTALYSSTFVPPTSPLTAITNTSLLVCHSNRYFDGSENAYTIVRGGNVPVKGFGPFVETDTTTGSVYLDGTGDYLEISSGTSLDFGSNSFTVECWIYVFANTGGTIFGDRTAADYNGVKLLVAQTATGQKIGGLISNNGINFAVSATAGAGNEVVPIGTWGHLAWVRNDGTFRFYVNGKQTGGDYTLLGGVVQSSSVSRIGYDQGDTDYFTGLISNFRIVKGTAVYTTNFTPPTSPLTAVANTALLTLQKRIGLNNNSFVDESGFGSLIYKAGNVAQGSFSPFAPTGWSGYFDGTGDLINITAGSTNLNFGTGNFTIEFWMYGISISTNCSIIDNRNPDTANQGFQIGLSSSALVFTTSNITYITGTTLSNNTWYHVALTRSGDSFKLFLNGTQTGSTYTGSATQNFTNTNWRIGSGAVGAFTGYISNVRFLKSSALYTTTFTPPTTSLAMIGYTQLLILNNCYTTDQSPNRHALTISGDVKVVGFSPFGPHTTIPKTYGVYFDGTGDYLTTPAALDTQIGGLAGSTWTIEAWIYLDSVSASNSGVCGFVGNYQAVSANGRWVLGYIGVNSSTAIKIRFTYTTSTGTENSIVSTNTFGLNQWHHVAMTIDATTSSTSTIKFFVNGTLEDTFTSQNLSTHTDNYESPSIGGNFSAFVNAHKGFISNLRIVKGNLIYSSAFTPSTTALTATTNTVLLTCQSNRLIDNSYNNFAITPAGNTIVTTFNPFGETTTTGVSYSPNTHGGSMLFDGTGDYLAISNNSTVFTMSGDFTIEAWVYQFVIGTTRSIYGALQGSNIFFNLRFNTSNQLEMSFNSGAGTTFGTAAPVIYANTWYHVAASRSGSSVRGFINGVLQPTVVTNSSALNGGNTVIVGATSTSSNLFRGFISGLRVLNGTALYTTAFVPPVTPPLSEPSTLVLVNGENAGIIDKTARNVFESVDGVRIHALTKKYGSGSVFFDGTTDSLILSTTPDYDFSGDFTVELWANFSTLSTNRILLDRWASGNAGGWQLYWRGTGTSLTFFVNATIIIQDASTTRITTGTWYHIALARSGSTVRLFVDGTSVGSNTFTTSLTSTLPLNIGVQGSTNTNYFNGYMDDIRITKGVARYTTTFTPPTESLPVT